MAHYACPGGCGELADECACARPNPLGSMTVSKRRHLTDGEREVLAQLRADQAKDERMGDSIEPWDR